MDDYQTRMRIKYALKERDARLAALIVESVRNSMDMIEAQSPTTLEVVIEFVKEMEPNLPKARAGVRAALLEFVKCALRRQKEMEYNLLQGLTGKAEE
jgi:hypothetical protein